MRFLLFLLFCGCLCVSGEPTNYIKHLTKVVRRKVERIVEESAQNLECADHLKLFVADLYRRKKWAVEMLDANSKMSPGVLAGNINSMGHFDQCLNVKETFQNYSTVTGQYCTVLVSPKKGTIVDFELFPDRLQDEKHVGIEKEIPDALKHTKVSFGVCVPSSCDIASLQSIWKYIDSTFAMTFNVEFTHVFCEYKGKPIKPFGLEGFVYFYFGSAILILICASIYDWKIGENSNDLPWYHKYVICFSMPRNAEKLFNSSSGEDNLSCVNGLKAINILWVVMGHRYLFDALAPNIDTLYILEEFKKKKRNMFFIGSTVAVDSFLAISGLLLSYLYLRYTQVKEIKINLSSFYILRYCRLIPPMLAMICIYIGFSRSIGDGPLWSLATSKIGLDCVKKGWMNLLFINNFISFNAQCLPQTWYLAVDSQLYFIFPIIFLATQYYGTKNVFKGLLAATLLCTAYTFFITIYYEYGAIFFEHGGGRYMDHVYQNSICRFPTWVAGVITGYLLFENKEKNNQISKKVNLTAWAACAAMMLLVLYCQILFLSSPYWALRSATYNAFVRPFWGVCICWIIYACVTGNGYYVNKFLSYSGFNLISKLTYSIFITHLGILLFIGGRRRTAQSFGHVTALHAFCGDCVFILIFSAIFSLMFESPLIGLAKLVFKKYEELKSESIKGETKIITRYILWIFPVPVIVRNIKKID